MSERPERTYVGVPYNPPVSPSPTLPREGERVRTVPYNPPVRDVGLFKMCFIQFIHFYEMFGHNELCPYKDGKLILTHPTTVKCSLFDISYIIQVQKISARTNVRAL